MSMQLRIVHRSEYVYDGPAMASYNQARMAPAITPEQIVVHHRLDISPTPWTHTYTDYFGTAVTVFEVVDPHELMTVTASSTVQVSRDGATPEPSAGWEAYVAREVSDRWTEYLVLPDLVAPPVELATSVEEVGARSALPGEAALAVCRLAGEQAGACQEVVHLAIGGLRSLGIPARYVSGYVHPGDAPVVGETVAGESRAWLEWWDDGWRGWDPTADRAPDDRYVAIGHGRDYTDVPPLRGIYAGAQTANLTVDVEVTRLA
ncbi:transglutaminase family protein [Nocardioides sp. J54]|uniref:transglutaminase family protein n=1 Tax=Nocardioides sp. J54 TaxID=935866 RepID=UPI0004B7439F|nr:transglutaminase family protein [Nocardioides sp. J54]